MMEAKSGKQLGEENVRKLQEYLMALEQQGGSLPLSVNGKTNISAIALACGFDRQVLYKNPAAKQLIEAAARRIGAQAPEKVGGQTVAYQAVIDQKDRRIRDLEERLVSREAELQELRQRLGKAEASLKRYPLIEEHFIETGRRIIP